MSTRRPYSKPALTHYGTLQAIKGRAAQTATSCPRCIGDALEAVFAASRGPESVLALLSFVVEASRRLKHSPIRFCEAHAALEVALCGHCGHDVHSYRCPRCCRDV